MSSKYLQKNISTSENAVIDFLQNRKNVSTGFFLSLSFDMPRFISMIGVADRSADFEAPIKLLGATIYSQLPTIRIDNNNFKHCINVLILNTLVSFLHDAVNQP